MSGIATMPNFGAKILNIATGALHAQQTVIGNLSNNIANVNTAGYTRRTVNLQTGEQARGSGGIDIGSGVNVQSIQRMADEYLNKVLRDTTGDQSSSQVQNELLARVDKLFSLDGTTTTISTSLDKFFSAFNDLASNPSSIQLRKVAITEAQNLVSSLQTTYTAVSNIQDEADDRVGTEVTNVNTLTTQIAALNQTVSGIEQGGQGTAADARDQRDELLRQLATKISFKTVESADGQVNVYLANGFNLVAGSKSYDLSFTHDPSFASGSIPPSLSGKSLGYVTYDYSGGAGSGDFDLTDVLKDGGGSIGGLLKVRGSNPSTNTSPFEADGPLVEVAARIEGITRALLTNVNATYQGTDEDSSTAGFQPNALDLNGNTPSIYGLFDFTYSGTKDANGDNRPNDLDLLGVPNFTSLLKVTTTDPMEIAAARDANPANGALSLATGDNQNALAIANLQTSTIAFSGGTGSTYSLTGTFNDAYSELITHIGSAKSTMQNKADLDKSNLNNATSQRDQVSAVSLDEEFSNLIIYQKAYQAAGKMIKVADDMLTQVIQLL